MEFGINLVLITCINYSVLGASDVRESAFLQSWAAQEDVNLRDPESQLRRFDKRLRRMTGKG